MGPAELKEMAWLLMLIPFGIVLGIGIFFFYCTWRRAGKFRAAAAEFEAAAAALPGAFRPTVFDQPTRWLAIKAGHPSIVQAALRLHHPVSCSWEEGLAEAHDDKLFISPAISGWVLVVGSVLPEPAEDVDACYRFLTALSRKVGHVQFFSSSRVVNYHCWALMEKGHVYRAYAWAGETLWNQGQMTAAERDLGMLCLGYGSEHNPFTMRDALGSNSEKINQLAARWSVDPGAVSASAWNGRGIVGEVSHSKPH